MQNVKAQFGKTDFSEQLIGGVVLAGGGANMKNIDKACIKALNVDKVRIAKKVITPIVKNSTLTNLNIESPANTAIISLLLSGSENCVGDDAYKDPDIFGIQDREKQIEANKAAAAENQKEEDSAVSAIEDKKNYLRELIIKMQHCQKDIEEDPTIKRHWNTAKDLIANSDEVLSEDDFQKNMLILSGKDKYRQVIREAEDLISKLEATRLQLQELSADAEKKNSLFGKISGFFNDLLNNE